MAEATAKPPGKSKVYGAISCSACTDDTELAFGATPGTETKAMQLADKNSSLAL